MASGGRKGVGRCVGVGPGIHPVRVVLTIPPSRATGVGPACIWLLRQVPNRYNVTGGPRQSCRRPAVFFCTPRGFEPLPLDWRTRISYGLRRWGAALTFQSIRVARRQVSRRAARRPFSGGCLHGWVPAPVFKTGARRVWDERSAVGFDSIHPRSPPTDPRKPFARPAPTVPVCLIDVLGRAGPSGWELVGIRRLPLGTALSPCLKARRPRRGRSCDWADARLRGRGGPTIFRTSFPKSHGAPVPRLPARAAYVIMEVIRCTANTRVFDW